MKHVTYYSFDYGTKKVDDCTREELLEVIRGAGERIRQLEEFHTEILLLYESSEYVKMRDMFDRQREVLLGGR